MVVATFASAFVRCVQEESVSVFNPCSAPPARDRIPKGRGVNMITTTYAITTLVVLTAAYIVLKKALGAYLKFRGTRIISCPETCKPAAVEVDAGRAVLTEISGEPKLQLKYCSRWPELQDCGQDCLRQIELSPEECLVRNILADWYRGKKCIHCGKPIGEIDWLENKPALHTPQGLTVQC